MPRQRGFDFLVQLGLVETVLLLLDGIKQVFAPFDQSRQLAVLGRGRRVKRRVLVAAESCDDVGVEFIGLVADTGGECGMAYPSGVDQADAQGLLESGSGVICCTQSSNFCQPMGVLAKRLWRFRCSCPVGEPAGKALRQQVSRVILETSMPTQAQTLRDRGETEDRGRVPFSLAYSGCGHQETGLIPDCFVPSPRATVRVGRNPSDLGAFG